MNQSDQLSKFEIQYYLVEELEQNVLYTVLKNEEFWDFYLGNPIDNNYFARYLQGPLHNDFYKYIYTKSKPLNANEINSWLTISLNQFKTHIPSLRKEYLKENFIALFWPSSNKESQSTLLYDQTAEFFEIIFRSYEQNFYLFENTTIQAFKDFKNGYLGSFIKLSTQSFQDSKKKIKTSLSVPELAYFFRSLKDEGIIKSDTNTEIYDFIIETFSSIKQDEISANSIKNHFEKPEISSIQSWQVRFGSLAEKAKKDQEKATR